MSEAVIRLDKTKQFAECRGERTPDDPHYRVSFWQGQLVGKVLVQLPFDSEGKLVPDDGKTAKYEGINSEGKKVEHSPLYTQAMRDLVERKRKKLAAPAAKLDDETDTDGETGGEGDTATDPVDDVNFESYLRGEAQYTPQILRAAAKKRYHINYPDVAELVAGLVLDERVVSEAELAPDLARHLRNRAAA